MFFRVWLTSFSVIFGSNELNKLHSLLFVTIVHIKSTNISPHEDLTSQRWRRANALSSLLGRTLPKAQWTQKSAFQPHLASESWPKLDSITSTKHRQQNIDQTLVSDQIKSCLNLNFKILTKPCAQSLNKSLVYFTKPQRRKLHQIVANMILISNS